MKRLALLWVLGWALGVALPSAAAGPTPPRPTASLAFGPSERGFTLTLSAVPGASASTDLPRRELLVRAGQALPAFDAAALQTRAAGWLEGVHVGYDSLLLRLAPGVRVVPDSHGATLTLHLERPALAPAPSDTGAALRLAQLRARLALGEQQIAPARALLQELHARHPDRAEPLVGLAQVEAQSGRWRRSLALYQQALPLDGAEADLPDTIAALQRSHAGGMRLEAEQRWSEGGDQVAPVRWSRLGAEGARRLAPAWRLGLGVETAWLRTDAIRRASGQVEPFDSSRQRAALSLQHDSESGTVQTVALFAGHGTAGLGGSRQQPDDHGATRVSLELRRPNWDFVETFVERAWRDRLALARTQRLGPGWTAQAELGLNRYALADESSAARSTSLAAQVRWEAPDGVPGLSLTYALDAEYIHRLATRINTSTSATGEVFALLPLLDREIHSATLGYSRALAARWGGGVRLDAQAGLGLDRFGRGGPLLAAALAWERAPLQAQLRASHVRNVGAARGNSSSLGARFTIDY